MITNIKELYNKPYITIPFLVDNKQIEKTINSFFEFLDLPDSIKFHMDLKISPHHRRGDIGLKHRDPEEDIYNDSKDFFHYHPIIEEEYKDFIAANPIVKNFLQNASLIWKLAYQSTKEVLSFFEQDNSGTLDKIFGCDTPHILLRFLRYNYPKSGKYLAKPHFDAGSFTLAIAESSPGLRIGTKPEDLKAIEHMENSAIFMVSSNYKKILDNAELNPAWHDVIQLDESKIDKPFSRWAIVAFIDGHSVEALPRSETHKFFTISKEDL